MARISSLPDSETQADLAGAVCAIGVFDGVHLGHRLVIGKAADEARARGAEAVVITFDIDPDELFAPDSLRKLQANDERIAMLASLPVDAVMVIPFDEDVASIEARRFLDELFGANVPGKVYVGSDFRFGAKAQGDVALLASWGLAHGMEVEAVELLEVDGAPVKSTRIRKLLDEGCEGEANRLLGRG